MPWKNLADNEKDMEENGGKQAANGLLRCLFLHSNQTGAEENGVDSFLYIGRDGRKMRNIWKVFAEKMADMEKFCGI